MKTKKWSRVSNAKKTHGLTFVWEGVGFISKTFARNNECFNLNKKEEMTKSTKCPKKYRA
jgi:hypothetical protein